MSPPSAKKGPAKPKSTPARSPLKIAELPLAVPGVTHPELGVGLWNMGRWTHEDEAHTKAAIGRAMEREMRWFDTAEVYGAGRSERLLGDCLARAGPPARPFVVTKLSREHLRTAQVRPSLLGSLRRLGRQSIDLYLIHGPDPSVPLTETMPPLETLWKEKRTAAIGVSNFNVEELEKAQEQLSETRIAVNQVRFNILDRADAAPIQEYCAKHQILIEAYTPLARGLLTGRYLEGEAIPPETQRFARRYFDQADFPVLLQRARALRDLAEAEKVPLTSIALHWLRTQGAVPVVGGSKPEHIDATLDAFAQRPSDATLQRANAIARGDRD
jgi:aryl-alcohol dehydrogenase-like predicted oxidoreductase